MAPHMLINATFEMLHEGTFPFLLIVFVFSFDPMIDD